MQIGTSTRKPFYREDEAYYGNLDRLRSDKRKLLKEIKSESSGGATMESICAFDKHTNEEFIIDSSVRYKDGCICILMQTTDAMNHE